MVAMLEGGDVRPCRCVRCPACCGDGPGAFLSSTCGHQVAHPAVRQAPCPRSTQAPVGLTVTNGVSVRRCLCLHV